MCILQEIRKDVKQIKKEILGSKKMTKLEREYKNYKFFADTRGMKLLADKGLIDEYNSYMSELENILFAEERTLKIELPKPSEALEKFKNKFNKFF